MPSSGFKMSYQISTTLGSMSHAVYHYREGTIHHQRAGIIETNLYEKPVARRSLDECSKYAILILCNHKYRGTRKDKDKKDDAEIKEIAKEHLRKKKDFRRKKKNPKN
jgi:hypothetical protein